MRKVTRALLAVSGAVVLAAGDARAQGADEDLPAVRLSGAGVELMRLGVAKAEGDTDGTAAETLVAQTSLTSPVYC